MIIYNKDIDDIHMNNDSIMIISLKKRNKFQAILEMINKNGWEDKVSHKHHN